MSPVPTALKPVLVDLCEISALAMDVILLPVPTVFSFLVLPLV